jgi:Zn-finger nucleic acid-binding protein
MDTVTEQGICIDRCRICHGVFLDKGELEHLRMAATKSEGGFDFGSFVLGGLLF